MIAASHNAVNAACIPGADNPLVQHGGATRGSCHAVCMAQHFCEMHMSIYNDMLRVPMPTVADTIVCLQATAKLLAFHLGKPLELAACRLGACSSGDDKLCKKKCTTCSLDVRIKAFMYILRVFFSSVLCNQLQLQRRLVHASSAPQNHDHSPTLP
jgi:hypothetical protein